MFAYTVNFNNRILWMNDNDMYVAFRQRTETLLFEKFLAVLGLELS